MEKKNNYLVSVFVDGKNVNSYYSDNLDDLITIRAIHKGCEVSVFDLRNFCTLSREQVELEIQHSGSRWKKSLEKSREPIVKAVHKRVEKKKAKKYWERPVMCVETGQVYPSIRDCSEKTGIPYMTITNCIRRKNATRGVHFINAPRE